jgi:hypothetical protein
MDKNRYLLNQNEDFVIQDYNQTKPFSSFFPGIAGEYGVPMWVFYVNRGQAIASFGIKDKDNAILEFQPANKSYRLTPIVGFRTFIKMTKGKKTFFYEPFQDNLSNAQYKTKNSLSTGSCDLKLQEINFSLGLQVNVEYFTIPQDDFSALARIVTVKNLKNNKQVIELVDGLPQIIPLGVNNWFLKHLGRTVEAWMHVSGLEKNFSYYKLQVDPADTADISHITGANFYLSFLDDGKLIKPIVDPDTLFGSSKDLLYPKEFVKNAAFKSSSNQILSSKTPCAFSFSRLSLKGKAQMSIYSLIGNVDNEKKFDSILKRCPKKNFFIEKRSENCKIIRKITNNCFTMSSSLEFDAYCRQNYLDNIMRGGYPLSLKTDHKNQVLYVYSRIHGDLERDYNNFQILPTYFSQGNGNYRDVNQNRRLDNWFNSDLSDENIRHLLSLIQLDGYNPLVVKGCSFKLSDYPEEDIFKTVNREDDKKDLQSFFSCAFTPGHLLMYLKDKGIKLKTSPEEFLISAIRNSENIYDAEHGEGFWSDHWAYNTDLLESYLKLYPEHVKELFIDNRNLTFFDNAHYVRPRAERYVLKRNNVRQLNSLGVDHNKQELIKRRSENLYMMRTGFGQGQIYRTNLLVKLLCLILNKITTLDPLGSGIEMEGNKPNWFDSLNGLPALFGSSSCETIELKRLIEFIINTKVLDFDGGINIPYEIVEFLNKVFVLLQNNTNDDFVFWQEANIIKEEYRRKTRLGIDGNEENVSLDKIKDFFQICLKKLGKAVRKSFDVKKGIYNSYFINEVIDFEKDGDVIKPKRFKQIPVASFLESQMHALRVEKDTKRAKSLYSAVKNSDLFDKELKMYKVCSSLKNESLEIGRCRVFTPGWLENESIWLHMEYKYLLELLKFGLIEEFYNEFDNCLIPFQKPERYGRSILENSSFLVSSAHPDKKIWGNGFVARLSGSTVEFMNIWLWMCAGSDPFKFEDGLLKLELKPVLKAKLFTKKDASVKYFHNGVEQEVSIEKNSFAFVFLSNTLVVYSNPSRKDTFGKSAAKIKKIILEDNASRKVEFTSSVIPEEFAKRIRLGLVKRIDISLA